jgi:hypothetical protein
MTKMIIAAVLGIVSLGAVVIARADYRPSRAEGDGLRNLLLNAAGTQPVQPGQVRIPIQVEGTAYEVVIAKPGEPRAVRVAGR